MTDSYDMISRMLYVSFVRVRMDKYEILYNIK